MDITLWVQRIESAKDKLRFVGTAADLAIARKELRQHPAAFVLPGREQAQPNDLMNDVYQTVQVEVGVVLAVRHAGSVIGSAHVDALNGLRSEVRSALLGWIPDDGNQQVEFVDGRLLDFDKRVLWWMDSYRSEYAIQHL